MVDIPDGGVILACDADKNGRAGYAGVLRTEGFVIAIGANGWFERDKQAVLSERLNIAFGNVIHEEASNDASTQGMTNHDHAAVRIGLM
jgi:hypothetical protein